MKETKKVGRKLKYGEETILMRIPKSMVPDVHAMLEKREVLTDKWEESALPPAAQKMINAITDIIYTYYEGIMRWDGEGRLLEARDFMRHKGAFTDEQENDLNVQIAMSRNEREQELKELKKDIKGQLKGTLLAVLEDGDYQQTVNNG